ncbi:DUF4097 family beta strand repeat-containing protein [Nonomuraea spiralis]|uniref:DUF4097 family beta strand repeat-containing protein n=1 Tax=Nonomuraea TaxID=83681 RepID=UPI000F7752C7|nr:DUF4097 family beta strand repeat-containing protein [Nonomuraea sp. WAC 01424]RSN12874.1 hypothetical protein DMB42_11900 [Nonomuraea sp. WAC 01424]
MKTIAVAGGLLAAALVLTGCRIESFGGSTSQDTASYEVKDKVSKLQVKSDAGDTVITETDGTAIRVIETLRWRGDDKPRPQHKVEGQALFVTYDCPSNWGSCSVDYKIEIPKGLAVDLDSGSGDITLRALSGQLDVELGSGDIDGSNITGKKAYVKAGSGNVELKYAAAPDSAELECGSGDITLRVPTGAYDIKTDVGSGDASVPIKSDPASPHKISLTAGSGDVVVSAG